MSFLSSKWFLLIALIAVILVVLFLIGKKSVHSEEIVPATPNQVWSVLMDTENYDRWNEVMVSLTGEFKEGNSITFTFNQEAGVSYQLTTSVKKVVEGQLLNQAGGTFGIITYDHFFILEPVEGGTKVTIHEDYRGVFVPFWNPKPVQKAYDRINRALKQRVIEVTSNE